MKPTITKENAMHIVKVACYVGGSAILSYLITVLQNKPELFGVLTPIINVLLVTIKELFKAPESEL